MTDLVQIGSAGGIVLLLATVIGYLLNSNRQDRAQHREERQDLRTQIKDLDERHTMKIAKLEARIAALESELESERRNVLTEQLRAERAEHRLELRRGGLA